MTDLLIDPDLEALTVAYLPAQLANQGFTNPTCSTKLPATIPPPYVHVLLTGGFAGNLVTSVIQLTFDCYGADETESSRLARTTHGLMRALAGQSFNGVWVRKLEDVGAGLPQNLPDPDTGNPRYTFTVRLHVKPEITTL